MKFYNAFGIKPTNTFTSAGSDYYVPDIKNKKQREVALKAFEKSYGKTTQEIERLVTLFETLEDFGLYDNTVNLVHLFLATYDPCLEQIKNERLSEAVLYFLDNFVVYDETKNVVGVKLNLNDTLFINSGVKIALDTVLSKHVNTNTAQLVNLLRELGIGVAGLYVNKSGKGNAGWDIRACLVDEDYSGYVHLSMAYTKDVVEDKQNIVYCGDKLTQMILIPIFHDSYEDANEDEYENIMQNSQRGDSGFGSSDIKH